MICSKLQHDRWIGFCGLFLIVVCYLSGEVIGHNKVKRAIKVSQFKKESVAGQSRNVYLVEKEYFDLEHAARKLGLKERRFLARIRNAGQGISTLKQVDQEESSSRHPTNGFDGNAFDEHLFSMLLTEQLEADSMRTEALLELETNRIGMAQSYLAIQTKVIGHMTLMYTFLTDKNILTTASDGICMLSLNSMTKTHGSATRALEKRNLVKLKRYLDTGYKDKLFSKFMLMILIDASSTLKVNMSGIPAPRSWFFYLEKQTEVSIMRRTGVLWHLNRGDTRQAKRALHLAKELQHETTRMQRQLVAMGLSTWDTNADLQCRNAWAEWDKIEKMYTGLPTLPQLCLKLSDLTTARLRLEKVGSAKTSKCNQHERPQETLDQMTGEQMIECSRMKEMLAGEVIDALKHEWEAWISFEKGDRVGTLRSLCQAEDTQRSALQLAKIWMRRNGEPLSFATTKKYLALEREYSRYRHKNTVASTSDGKRSFYLRLLESLSKVGISFTKSSRSCRTI